MPPTDSQLVEEILRRVLSEGMVPVPFWTRMGATAASTDGGTDHLALLAQHPQVKNVLMVMISLSPASGAGVWRSDGPSIQSTTDGNFVPSGGGIIYLFSEQEIRFFRMRADGATSITWSASAYGMVPR